MKRIFTFNEFLLESKLDSINESNYNPNAVKQDVAAIFKKNGFAEVKVFDNGVLVNIDTSTELQIKQTLADIEKYGRQHKNILILKTLRGYSSDNEMKTMIAAKPVKARKVFHVAAKANLDNIMQKGLIASEAQAHSSTFSKGLSGENVTMQLYAAVFGVTSIGAARKMTNYFKIPDPVILEINAKGYTWWVDPLMPEDMKSVVTFDSIIKPTDIKIAQ